MFDEIDELLAIQKAGNLQLSFYVICWFSFTSTLSPDVTEGGPVKWLSV